MANMKVTLLSGFLGAGKTTLLKRILRLNNELSKDEKLNMAVIVNDMGEINLDADEIKNSKVVQEEAQMVEMHNGCICCTLRGDLLKTVKSLSEEGKFDYLVIESTGIGEPLPVAQTFVMDVDNAHDHDHGDGDEDEEENDDEEEKQESKRQKVDEEQEESKKSLSHYATLDTLVTVVDSLNIYDVLGSIETLADQNNASGMLGNTGAKKEDDKAEEKKMDDGDDEDVNMSTRTDQQEEEIDDRPISQLWLDQIEFANVIVVSKASIFLEREKKNGNETPEKKLEEIESFLHRLNPKAKIIISREDKYADLDVSKTLINTGLFNMEEAESSDMWLEELEKEEHNPETEEYGISSMTFESADMPFHPDRLAATLTGFGDYGTAVADTSSSTTTTTTTTTSQDSSKEKDIAGKSIFKGVFRSKGQIWLANANAFPLDFHTAGKHIQMSINEEETPFLAAMNKTQWEETEKEAHKEFLNDGMWTEKYGDRRSKLVFIGMNLNKALIHEKLTEALLTEKESKELGGMKGWRKLSDPFFGEDVYDHFELPHPYGAPYEDV